MNSMQNPLPKPSSIDLFKKCASSYPDDGHIVLEIVTGSQTEGLPYGKVKDYITNICRVMKLEELNMDRITNSVYPKLKLTNTFHELNQVIISSSAELITEHYDYQSIAVYLLINELHEKTHNDYLEVARELAANINVKGKATPVLSTSFVEFVQNSRDAINSILRYDRDYDISFFGIRTLEKSYLKGTHLQKIVERPQHMYMRVAIALHYRSQDVYGEGTDSSIMDKIAESYHLMSSGYFTHATPTLFNAGTNHEQLSSCFLLGIEDDMKRIGDCWGHCAVISKYAGGIGVNISNIRSDGAYITSTQGPANGLKVLPVFNQVARFANQGGKRSGSIAFYVEPWHADIYYFLDLKKTNGAETERARDIFLALMINDIFMERVHDDATWSLMCPADCPNILNKFGKEFNEAYILYETQGIYKKQIKARDLWFKIMEMQIETGIPYIVFKDAVNHKTNQSNIGVINGSNLCAEIVEYSDANEYAVCFTDDTEILTTNGVKKIIDCDGEKVFSYFDNDQDLHEHQHFETAKLIHNGTKTVYELKTNGNKVINSTKDHPFLVLTNRNKNTKENEYEWKKLKDLKVGDKLITPKTNTLPQFKISRENFQNEYLAAGWRERVCFESIDKIKNELPVNQAAFLSAYFSAEGRVLLSNNRLSVLLTSASENILYEVQSMLIPFGIRSNVSYEVTKGTLSVHGQQNIENFRKYINFELCPDKKNRLEKHINVFDRKRVRYSDYSKVISVRELGERNVYDLSLGKSHNFIANGHVVHNCNLASICLPKFVEKNDTGIVFNYQKLYEISRIVTRNLDNVIDVNFYPVIEAQRSNSRHRPIGLGVQGLADVFAMFRTAFDSEIARDLNRKIFETIYFGAQTESMMLAQERGVYPSYHENGGAPISHGKFQFDLWNMSHDKLSGMWDFEALRQNILKHGIRNSLTTTIMPTATTSQISGNNECIEPYTTNIYSRSTLAGDYYVINRHLMRELMDIGLWNTDIVDAIKYYSGSIQMIPEIPDHVKAIYKTAFEMSQKSIIEMAIERGPFVDQTQSMNIFIGDPNYRYYRLNSCLMTAWKGGLKTGIYYLRSKPVSEANQFGIDIEKIRKFQQIEKAANEIAHHESEKEMQAAKAKWTAIIESPKTEMICQRIPRNLRKFDEQGNCTFCSS